jgi:hypothetical protein
MARIVISKLTASLNQSIGVKSDMQWRVLFGLWSATGLIVAFTPWNVAFGVALFTLFVHLAATE